MPQNKPTAIIWQYSTQFDPQAIPLDKNGQLNKETLLSQLKEAFNFPDYFGENWDAAYDLLLDQVMQIEEREIWRFSMDAESEVNQSDLAIWTQVMTDVSTYAESKGRRLQIIVQSNTKED